MACKLTFLLKHINIACDLRLYVVGGGGPVDRPEEEDFQLCSLLGFAKVLGLEKGQESDVLGSYTPPVQR